MVHPDAPKSGIRRLRAFQQATNNAHLITGYDDPAFVSQVPPRVHPKDRHIVAAALVLANGLDEEDEPANHKVVIVSDNTRHLAISDTRKLGIEVLTAGAFLDQLFAANPRRTGLAIAKAQQDLRNPPYSTQEMLAALRLHGAKALAAGLAAYW